MIRLAQYGVLIKVFDPNDEETQISVKVIAPRENIHEMNLSLSELMEKLEYMVEEPGQKGENGK